MVFKFVCINPGSYDLTLDKVYNVAFESISGSTPILKGEPVEIYVIYDDANKACIFTNMSIANSGSGAGVIWDYFCSLDDHRQKQLTKLV